MDFVSDLGADSLDLYQIFTGVEDELGVTIPPGEVEHVKTVQDAVTLIKQRM